MKRSRFFQEQMVFALPKAESGSSIGDLCRDLV